MWNHKPPVSPYRYLKDINPGLNILSTDESIYAERRLTKHMFFSWISNMLTHSISRTPEAGPLLLKVMLNGLPDSLLICPLCKCLFGLNVVQAQKLKGFESYHAFVILQVIQSMFTVVGQPLCIPYSWNCITSHKPVLRSVGRIIQYIHIAWIIGSFPCPISKFWWTIVALRPAY